MNDLIYRQAAIDALIEWYGCEPSDIGAFENIIDKLPSAQPEKECEKCIFKPFKQFQPERKKGEWIETEFLKLRECSCCHVRWGMYDVENFNFCPNCGADMRRNE